MDKISLSQKSANQEAKSPKRGDIETGEHELCGELASQRGRHGRGVCPTHVSAGHVPVQGCDPTPHTLIRREH